MVFTTTLMLFTTTLLREHILYLQVDYFVEVKKSNRKKLYKVSMFTRVRFVFLGVALLCSLSVFAQALSGVVTDQKSREGLISATVQLIAGDGKINYTSTDLKGMFQFKKLPAGTYTLQISYVGYKTYKEAVIIPSSGEKRLM